MAAKIISAHELECQSAEGSVKIFDCRFALNDPDAGRAAYEGSHIPGAVYVDLEKDLSGPVTSGTGRHPLPDFAVWRETLLSLQINANSTVVLYDGGPGVFAARFWWMLGWAGIPDVMLLDGGFEEWRRQGLPLGTEEHSMDRGAVSGDTVSQVESAGYVNVDYLVTRLSASDPLVVDAREPERFSGRKEPLDKKAGCIPGAVNRHFALNLSKGKFKAPESLREEFMRLLDARSPETVVHSCGSGVTACHNLFAMELAGLSGSRLYPGSWSEWITDPERPIEVHEG
tara:strand:+ start:42 stop:899 length:858 start_codon:yes stop_codon:yes gene_type:complete